MDKNITFTTVEELATYVLANPYNTDRFNMDETSNQVYDNPQDGTAWDELNREASNRRWKYRRENPGCEETPEYQAMIANEDALQKIRPPMHTKHYLTLRETGDGWSRKYFYIEGELVDQIKNIWTYKPSYRGSTYLRPAGALTWKGILTRLGKSDIGKQINKIIADKKAQDEKNSRNYQRKLISQKADELVKLLKANSDSLGLDLVQIPLPELVKLVEHLED